MQDQDNEKSIDVNLILDKNILLEYYKLLVPHIRQESSLHWNRHHIFLVVCIGLMAAVISQEIDFPLRVGAIIFGFLFSCLWTLTNIHGRFWHKRWYFKLGKLEEELSGEAFKIFQYENFKEKRFKMTERALTSLKSRVSSDFWQVLRDLKNEKSMREKEFLKTIDEQAQGFTKEFKSKESLILKYALDVPEADWLTWYCSWLSTTKCSSYFSILFAIAWLFLLIYYLVIR